MRRRDNGENGEKGEKRKKEEGAATTTKKAQGRGERKERRREGSRSGRAQRTRGGSEASKELGEGESARDAGGTARGAFPVPPWGRAADLRRDNQPSPPLRGPARGRSCTNTRAGEPGRCLGVSDTGEGFAVIS